MIESVCWTSKDGCVAEFKSASLTTLVRNESGEFEHVLNYEPVFNPEGYYEETEPEEILPSQCKGLIFSEVLTYYESERNEQFVELYNSTSEQIRVDGCTIRYKNKLYELSGVIGADKYKQFIWNDLALTKNPTNMNLLELVDVNGEIADKLEIYNGQKKGTSYALIGYDKDGIKLWRTTYKTTPGEPNIYQEFRTCEEGKVINEETGNCVKVAKVTVNTCPVGQYLNALTGRCNKVKTETVKTCTEGYYLNPETGRCNKIRNNDGADYDLKPETYEEKSAFVALYAILIVVGLVLLYIIYEFRHEIWKLVRRVFRRSH